MNATKVKFQTATKMLLSAVALCFGLSAHAEQLPRQYDDDPLGTLMKVSVAKHNKNRTTPNSWWVTDKKHTPSTVPVSNSDDPLKDLLHARGILPAKKAAPNDRQMAKANTVRPAEPDDLMKLVYAKQAERERKAQLAYESEMARQREVANDPLMILVAQKRAERQRLAEQKRLAEQRRLAEQKKAQQIAKASKPNTKPTQTATAVAAVGGQYKITNGQCWYVEGRVATRVMGSCPANAVVDMPPASRKQSYAVVLDGDSSFALNTSSLQSAAVKKLDNVVYALNKLPSNRKADVSIEGHADSSGKESWNLTLSKARAEEVAKYISQRTNRNKVKLYAVGRGSELARMGRKCLSELREYVKDHPTTTVPELRERHSKCLAPDRRTIIRVSEY